MPRAPTASEIHIGAALAVPADHAADEAEAVDESAEAERREDDREHVEWG